LSPERLDLVRTRKESRWQVFLAARTSPHFSGMKVATIRAIAGAVVGEFFGSERGLGFLMVQVQSSLDTRAMFIAPMLLTLVGVAVYPITIRLARPRVVKAAGLR
jgi:NitT/TauT family transport system permease protein